MAIFGPTAVGKSAVAHAMARTVGGEIVVADPFQRYRGLEIAADSPSERERREVRYHLVRDLALDEPSTAADFAHRAHKAIDDILDRGRVPIVAGGTGLYLRAALAELAFGAQAPAEVRRWAEAEVERDPEAAAARLRDLDPDAARAVDLRNPRRLARALGLASIGGKPEAGRLWSDRTRLPTMLTALVRPREVLDDRIARRVDRELDDGLIDELRAALAHPGVAREALQIIGAREVGELDAGRLSREDLPARLAGRTRRLARRQLAWLRRTPAAHELDLGDDDAERALAAVMKSWERRSGRR